jgi:hypothetical protein
MWYLDSEVYKQLSANFFELLSANCPALLEFRTEDFDLVGYEEEDFPVFGASASDRLTIIYHYKGKTDYEELRTNFESNGSSIDFLTLHMDLENDYFAIKAMRRALEFLTNTDFVEHKTVY